MFLVLEICLVCSTFILQKLHRLVAIILHFNNYVFVCIICFNNMLLNLVSIVAKYRVNMPPFKTLFLSSMSV